jgi:hypothetical protein
MGTLKPRHVRRSLKAFQWLLFFSFAIPSMLYAAPHPGMGSSRLVAPELGLFWKRQGFQLQTGASGWELASPMGDSVDNKVRYVRPAGESEIASMAVQIETLKSELTLENYAKKWMRDYVNYGFDVLGTQAFTQNKAKGLVVDLIHKKTDQQLRQILFLKNKKVVILTCRDFHKTFQQTLIGCNHISRTFEWSETLPTTLKR